MSTLLVLRFGFCEDLSNGVSLVRTDREFETAGDALKDFASLIYECVKPEGMYCTQCEAGRIGSFCNRCGATLVPKEIAGNTYVYQSRALVDGTCDSVGSWGSTNNRPLDDSHWNVWADIRGIRPSDLVISVDIHAGEVLAKVLGLPLTEYFEIPDLESYVIAEKNGIRVLLAEKVGEKAPLAEYKEYERLYKLFGGHEPGKFP